jgi:hypothetical protein
VSGEGRGRGRERQGRGLWLLTPPPHSRPAFPGKMADRAEMFSLSTFHSLSPPGCRYALEAPGLGRLSPSQAPSDPVSRLLCPALPPHPTAFAHPGPDLSLVPRPRTAAAHPPPLGSLRFCHLSFRPSALNPSFPVGILSGTKPGQLTCHGWDPWTDPLRGAAS